ncbi:MAG: PASTA domain-containing protein [Candidatus Cloacimonetes bacterium]|nr:PASTA domain-containing protein [Candidatus Cloacimonadota bacterium]MBS3766517.1 PASTA domain-containing protein [Candidatus Cloacimonadota bacterium]
MLEILKKIFYVIISFVIIFLLGFALSKTFLTIYTQHGNEVVVPDLVNKDYKGAKHNLYKKGLYIEKAGERNSREVLKGSIITQEPKANSVVKEGYTIEVIISKGPELIPVPTLDNLTLDEAKIRLINSGLEIGKVSYSLSDKIPRGNVLYSRPRSGIKTPKLSKVDLIISLGDVKENINDKTDKYDDFLNGLKDN